MAAITQTMATDVNGAVTIARTALSASDTLAYVQGSGQKLFLYNTTATAVTVTLNGSANQPINVPGFGGTIATSSGKAISVPANGSVLVDLDDIWAFLQGNVTVTGGTGVTAHLFI